MDKDDIIWLVCERGDDKCCFWLSSPYLYNDCTDYAARLVYTTQRPFGTESIGKIRDGRVWFKTVHRMVDGRRTSCSADAVQAIGGALGFAVGRGLDRYLSVVLREDVAELAPTRAISGFGKYLELQAVLDQAATFYGCSTDDFRVTGSAGFFLEPYGQLNDLDLVIPIDSIEQAERIAKNRRPIDAEPVWLKGRTWALRWRDRRGLIVCPFFIYRGLDIPVRQLRPTGEAVSGTIRIIDASHGLFNLPAFRCTGAVSRLVIRSTLGRGQLPVGAVLEIDCPVYEVVSGAWAGHDVGVVIADRVDLQENRLVSKESHAVAGDDVRQADAAV